MGKWTDKLYITHSEWAQTQLKQNTAIDASLQQPPFNCCSITLQPFTTPVTTRHGHVFDKSNVLDWIQAHPNTPHPIIGEPVTESDLIYLHYHSNHESAFHCPITRHVFNANSHIVAIATTGNVFSYAAISNIGDDALDPLSSVPFSMPLDLITLQLPPNLLNRQPNLVHAKATAVPTKPTDSAINTSNLSQRILSEMATTKFSSLNKPTATDTTSVPATASSVISTNRTAASFTSTSLDVNTKNETLSMDSNKVLYEQFCEEMMELRKSASQAKGKSAIKLAKKNADKGFGYAPRTCHNFLLLAAKGYYKNVAFHRLIPQFMIQGGDPTKTGRGGESAWGGVFDDEIRPSMRHDKRGLLCMANRGRDTNSSQFFITFAPAPHLDGKHTIFGRVVGGMDVLDRMESISTDANDQPVTPILILDAKVFVDPISDWITQDVANKAKARADSMSRDDRIKSEGTWLIPVSRTLASSATSSISTLDSPPLIGKYLKKPVAAVSGTVSKRGLESDLESVPKRRK